MLDRTGTIKFIAFIAIYTLAISGCSERAHENAFVTENDDIPIYKNWPMNYKEMIERMIVKSEEANNVVENTKLKFYKNGMAVEWRNGNESNYSFIIIDKMPNMAAVKLKDASTNRSWYWVLWWNSSRLIVFGNPMIYVMDEP